MRNETTHSNLEKALRRITKEDGDFIRQQYQVMKACEIAEILGLKTDQVRSWASNHNIHKINRSILSTEAQQFVVNNYRQMSYRQIANALGYTERQIRGWVNNHLAKKNRMFNESYFSDISLPNRAYWLGFIYADGWIINNAEQYNYELGIELRRSDRYMLENLNQELGGVHKIVDKESHKIICGNQFPSDAQSSVLRVYSKRIVMDLSSHGIACNKSNCDVFPIVPNTQFIEFLRGYFDGDGSLSTATKGLLRFDITGTNLNCFKYINKILLEVYGVNTNIYKHDEHTYKLICYRKADVRKLLDYIYNNSSSMCLLRKRQIYTSYYGLAA